MARGFFRVSGGIVLGASVVGCAGAVGAGAGAVMLGGAALTSGCYDAVDVVLVDAASGQRTCDAKVSAVEADGGSTEFLSCYHAALPLGKWTIVAERPGYQASQTELVVQESSRPGCRAVQSVEMAIYPTGQAREPALAVRPPRPGEQPLAPGRLPLPASLGEPPPPATQAPVPPAPGDAIPSGAASGPATPSPEAPSPPPAESAVPTAPSEPEPPPATR